MPKGEHFKKVEKKEKTFLIRFTKNEFSLIENHCTGLKIEKTEFLRNCIFDTIKKQQIELSKQHKIDYETTENIKQTETLNEKQNDLKPAKMLILDMNKQGKKINDIVEYLRATGYKTKSNTVYNYDNVNKIIVRNKK